MKECGGVFEVFWNEIAKEYDLSREEVKRVFDEVVSSFLTEVFGVDVEFFVEKGVFYVYKDEGIEVTPISELALSLVKGIKARVKKELRKRCEEERVLRVYRFLKRKIKTLVWGRVIGVVDGGVYVEFKLDDVFFSGSGYLIGFCPKESLSFFDRERLKRGVCKHFMIKNVYLERRAGFLRLRAYL